MLSNSKTYTIPQFALSLEDAHTEDRLSYERAELEERLRVMGCVLAIERYFDAFPDVSVTAHTHIGGQNDISARVMDAQGIDISSARTNTAMLPDSAQYAHPDLDMTFMSPSYYFGSCLDSFIRPQDPNDLGIAFLNAAFYPSALQKEGLHERLMAAFVKIIQPDGAHLAAAWEAELEKNSLSQTVALAKHTRSKRGL